MTVRIGLTGPIGCGKSTVARLARRAAGRRRHRRRPRGAGGRRAGRAGPRRGRRAVRARAAAGRTDRSTVRRSVGSSSRTRTRSRDLEAIVHPAVRPRILAAMDRPPRHGAAAVVVEAIKLVEGGLAEVCDEVWLVTATRGPSGRGWSVAAHGGGGGRADRRPGRARRAGQTSGDRVIDTSGDPGETRAFVETALHLALARSGDADRRLSSNDQGRLGQNTCSVRA